MRGSSLIAALALWGGGLGLALPGGATAAVHCAPPGVSSVSQYYETLPGVNCNQPSPRPAHHAKSSKQTAAAPSVPPAGGQGGSLPQATQQQLSAKGATGQAVQALVAQSGTAPPSATATRRSRSGHRRSHRSGPSAPAAPAHAPVTSVPASSSRSLIGGILHPLVAGSARGGIGTLLPVLLGVALLLAVVARLLRVRRRAA